MTVPSSVLNDALEWNQIPDQDRRAFRGVPLKMLLQPQQMLCRFITAESPSRGVRGNETFRSPWWMDWSTTISMLARWNGKVAPSDVIRARMAVPQAFSQNLDSLVKIVFTKPVYAWKGIAQFQNDSDRGLAYIGGGEQIYIPNLASDHRGFSSSVAHLQCFTSVKSLA